MNFIKRSSSLLIVLCLFFSCTTYKKITEESLIDETFPDINVYGGFLWSKKKNKTILIHYKNLKRIIKLTKKSDNIFFSDLELYLLFLSKKRKEIAKNINFSERAYIAGHIVDCLYKCQEKLNKNDRYKNKEFIYRLLSPWDSNKYNREFKKHDYYGLKLLKKHHLKHYKYFPDLDTIRYKKSISD